jgi:outer membrane protein TolC
MKKTIIALIIFFLLFIAGTILPVYGSSAADESNDHTQEKVTLEELIKEALANNPNIKRARYRWGAAIEKIPQAGSLPNPMFSYTYFPEPVETKLGPNDHRYMLSQTIPYPKKLSLKEEIAGHEAKAAALYHQKDIREVITYLSESYFELLYIQKALKITRQNKDILEELTKIGAADYAADSTALNDVLTAQSKLAQLNYDFLLLQELKETEIARINSLLNRPPESGIPKLEDIKVHLPYGIDELYETSAKNQEEIKIIDANIQKMQSAEKLAELSYMPDFKLELLYSQIDTPDGMQPEDAGRDAYGIKIGLSLPLWFSKNDSMIKEKSMKKNEMIQMKNARINMTNSMIKNLYFKMNNAQRLTELYSDNLIPQAETTMEKAEEWYKQKNSSFAQLLETQSVWLNFNLAYQRAVADYNKYAIRLQNLLGIELVYQSNAVKEK